MLAKGQPHIHLPALAVAWLKLTSVCLVLSVKLHGAHRQEMGGEREREREGGNVVGGIWREATRRNIQRARAAWESKALKSVVFTAALLKKRVVHFCVLFFVRLLPCSMLIQFVPSEEKGGSWMLSGQDFTVAYGPRNGGSHVGVFNCPWNIHYVTLSMTIYVKGSAVWDWTETPCLSILLHSLYVMII